MSKKQKPVVRYRIFHKVGDEQKVHETQIRAVAVAALKRFAMKGVEVTGATMQASTSTPGGWHAPIDINQQMWLNEVVN